MATAVQIELVVDEKGAIQGIRQFGNALNITSSDVRNLDSTLSKLNQHLDKLGTVAPRVRKIGEEAGGMHHQFQTSFDTVRLLRTELGVRVPRAMESIIARNQDIMAGLSKISSAMIGIGAGMIAFQFGKEVYDEVKSLWHNVLDVNGAIKDYQAEVRKTQQQDFGNSNSIATTTLRINQARSALRAYQEQASVHTKAAYAATEIGGLFEYINQSRWAHNANANAMNVRRQLDILEKQKAPEQTHQQNLEQIELQHASDGRLRGEAKITAELQKQLALNAENARYEQEQAGLYGNSVGRGSLWQTGHLSPEAVKDEIAQREAGAEQFNLERERSIELRHLHEQAVESGLKGTALMEAQESAAILNLRDQQIYSSKTVNDVKIRFHNEEMKRIEAEHKQTEELEGQAGLVSFKGVGHIQAQGDLDIAKVNGDPDLDEATKAERVAAIHMRVNTEMLDAQRQYTREVDSLSDETTEHEVLGFRRIEAERKRALDQARSEFQTQYGQTNRNTPEGEDTYQKGLADYQRKQALINSGAGYDSAELARRNADETEQIENEARSHALAAEKNQTQAIVAQYEERARKYYQQLRDGEILYADYNRRMIAAAQLRDADLVESAKNARDKMSGEFSSFFRSLDHPTEALKELGDQVAGKAAAALMQRVQTRWGTTHASSGGRGGRGGHGMLPGMDDLFGGVLDKIAGTPHAGPNLDKLAETRGTVVTPGATAGTFSLATAQIHIGAAQIMFASAGTAGSNAITASGMSSFSGSGATLSPAVYAGVNGSPYERGSGSASDLLVSSGGISGGGGAGSGSGGYAGGAGGGGSASAGGSGLVGNLSSGVDLGRQAFSIFHRQSAGVVGDSGTLDTTSMNVPGSFDKSGHFQVGSSGGSGMLQGGGVMSNLGGAAGGAAGLYSAYQSNGGVGGALSGAMSGMQLGMALGGPAGAAVGAAAGAIVGAIGFGGREKARMYDLRTVRPHIATDMASYEQGGMDYLSAYSDMQEMDRSAKIATNAMGPAAQSYYQDTIKKEIKQAEGRFDSMEKAGRSHFTATAAQFATGTDSVPHDGWAYIHHRERITPSDQNERITRGIESLASSESVAAGYRSAMQNGASRQTAPPSGWSGDLHIHAIDAKSVKTLMFEQKHVIRAAVNASYAENSGGADA